MSYAIGNIIYGIPLTTEAARYMNEEMSTDHEVTPEELGFETFYCAGSGNPGYCGVKLAPSIDECGDVNLAFLRQVPTEKEKAEAQEKLAKLPEELIKLCGPVSTWIVWSSS